ncbi:MAG: DUF4142 domain-containing protein [Magnetospirillum sp.]|nr:DUF4142 domain-containing protein [Magnetospirillum sp.]
MRMLARLAETTVAVLAAPLFTRSPPVALRQRTAANDGVVITVAEHALTAIAVAELAVERAERAEVRDYARILIGDYTALDAELAKMAADRHLAIPRAPTLAARAARAALVDLPAEDFDAGFIESALAQHRHCIAAFGDRRDDGRPPDLSALAARTLPVLTAHLNAAEALTGSKASPISQRSVRKRDVSG